MGIPELAKRLANRNRIGCTPELADKLGLKSEDAIRGQLLAEDDDAGTFLGVYLLAAYVVDDTDVWGDGEIYWWSIPALVGKDGKASWGALRGLPNGEEPHKCGSLEWMSNINLKEPPLLAKIPPDEELTQCVIRIAFYDDDGAPADLPKSMTDGLEALSRCAKSGLSGADQIISPVRDAIVRGLKAEEDDILIDQDIVLRRGQTTRFGAGFVGSEINSMVRVYYVVKDEKRTEQVGPMLLHRGQTETVKFQQTLEAGGRVTIFSRGAEVTVSAFGTLDTDTPFFNRALDATLAKQLSQGFQVGGTGDAKLIAFYTPP
jgi:hypothetical protein